MKFSEEFIEGANLIRSYEKGKIAINDSIFTRSLIVSTYKLKPDWAPLLCEEIQKEHIDELFEDNPEIVILGTGATLCFPSADILRHVQSKGSSLEVMDSGAACRTFNILVSEGRQVTAGLMML